MLSIATGFMMDFVTIARIAYQIVNIANKHWVQQQLQLQQGRSASVRLSVQKLRPVGVPVHDVTLISTRANLFLLSRTGSTTRVWYKRRCIAIASFSRSLSCWYVKLVLFCSLVLVLAPSTLSTETHSHTVLLRFFLQNIPGMKKKKA